METRKLQEVGGGTYTVSIPKAWATARGLEAGTPVNLYTHEDGSIVVRSRERDSDDLEATRIEIEDDPAAATRAIRAAQAVGFDRVTLASSEPFDAATCRSVRALARRFVGTDVVDENEDGRTLTVRNLLDADDVSIRQSVVQLQYVALDVHRQAVAAAVEPDEGASERLRERTVEAERLREMVVRHLNRSLVSLEEVDRLGTSRPELFDYYEAARELEAVAGDGVELARVADQLTGSMPEPVADELQSIAADTEQLVEDASNAVLGTQESSTAQRVLDGCDETRSDLDALEELLVRGETAATTVTDAVCVVRTVDVLGRTLEHARTIAEVALRASMRTE
jgi:phosphate uptake regulator